MVNIGYDRRKIYKVIMTVCFSTNKTYFTPLEKPSQKCIKHVNFKDRRKIPHTGDKASLDQCG